MTQKLWKVDIDIHFEDNTPIDDTFGPNIFETVYASTMVDAIEYLVEYIKDLNKGKLTLERITDPTINALAANSDLREELIHRCLVNDILLSMGIDSEHYMFRLEEIDVINIRENVMKYVKNRITRYFGSISIVNGSIGGGV